MMTDVQHIFTCSKGHLYCFFFVWYVLTMSILCLFTMFIDMLLWFSCFLLTFKCSTDANGVITPTAVTGQMRIQYSLDAAESIDTLKKEYAALEARVTALENA